MIICEYNGDLLVEVEVHYSDSSLQSEVFFICHAEFQSNLQTYVTVGIRCAHVSFVNW